MRTNFRTSLLVGATVWAMVVCGLRAQSASEPQPRAATPQRFELAVTYGTASANVVGGSRFWMQGASAEAQTGIYRGLSLVAGFSGLHQGSIHSSGVGLDLFSATFGPRYTWQPKHSRYAIFGQGLVGFSHGFNSAFPQSSSTASSQDSLAVRCGGGLNIALTPRIGLRAIEANWLRTQFPNAAEGVEGGIQLNTGIILRF